MNVKPGVSSCACGAAAVETMSETVPTCASSPVANGGLKFTYWLLHGPTVVAGRPFGMSP